MAAAFFDSSALVKLLRPEPETDALRAWTDAADGEHLASRIAVTEVTRAARRAQASSETVLRSLHFVELTPEVLEQAAQLDPPELRTLDAIHLASALVLGGAVDAFVCYDGALGQAAVAHGLTVVAPGA